MKKSVSLITLDSSLIRWLCEKLRISAPDSQSARELSDGLMDLMDGRTSSLMLELGEQETPAAVSEVIHCGALSIDLRLRRVKREDAEIALTPKEFDILYFLARNRGECLPRSRFIKRFGRVIICWTTATSWRLFESSERKSNPIRTHRSTY